MLISTYLSIWSTQSSLEEMPFRKSYEMRIRSKLAPLSASVDDQAEQFKVCILVPLPMFEDLSKVPKLAFSSSFRSSS